MLSQGVRRPEVIKRKKTGQKIAAKPKKAVKPTRPAPEPVGFRLALREEYRKVRPEGLKYSENAVAAVLCYSVRRGFSDRPRFVMH